MYSMLLSGAEPRSPSQTAREWPQGIPFDMRDVTSFMRPMREFDPDRPARLHEALNDKVVTWRTGWAMLGVQNALLAEDDEAVVDVPTPPSGPVVATEGAEDRLRLAVGEECRRQPKRQFLHRTAVCHFSKRLERSMVGLGHDDTCVQYLSGDFRRWDVDDTVSPVGLPLSEVFAQVIYERP